MNQKTKDALVLGFALFAVFFGAGNLIFPPLIGVVSGSAYEGRRGIPVAGRTGGDAGAPHRDPGGHRLYREFYLRLLAGLRLCLAAALHHRLCGRMLILRFSGGEAYPMLQESEEQ